MNQNLFQLSTYISAQVSIFSVVNTYFLAQVIPQLFKSIY